MESDLVPHRVDSIALEQHSQSTGLRVALLTYFIGIVGVVTLLPFRFHWPPEIRFVWLGGPFDTITNLCLFMPLGFLYRRIRKGRADPWCTRAVMYGGFLSLIIELAQIFLRGRYTSPLDVVTNGLGAWVGALIYDRVRRLLNERLVGQMALELPLMNLFYLLLPLLWLNGLTVAEDPSRLWLAPLLGLCGTSCIAAVWSNRLGPANVLSVNAVVLVVAVWFLLGSVPSFGQQPGMMGVCTIALIGVARARLSRSRLSNGSERRFELPTLKRIFPLYGAYLCLLSLWPLPWMPGPWRLFLGFAEIADIPQVMPTLRVVEYIAAFTIMGYMVAEFRGRQEETLVSIAHWLLLCGVVVGGLLELMRGFHPQYGASLTHLLLATAGTVYGGVVYRSQLATVQRIAAVCHDSGHDTMRRYNVATRP